MKILCRTLFDCTYTGTTGHFKIAQLPYVDAAGNQINTAADWTRSRNQQRNLETVLQIISLRAQPSVSSWPQFDQGCWSFEFQVETPGVYSSNGSAHGVDSLLLECQGTPMITGLNETQALQPYLSANENIWFETLNI